MALLYRLHTCFKHCFVIQSSINLLLHPVKNWITYIFSFYILLSAVVPCSIFDQCEEEEHLEQAKGSDEEQECSNCSPFSSCSSTAGFTVTSLSISTEPVDCFNSPTSDLYHFPSRSEYYPKLFQPPRVA